MVLKTWPLCTGAKSNLTGRVLGEVVKSSFIVCSAKGDTEDLCPQTLRACPSLEDLMGFVAMVQGQAC